MRKKLLLCGVFVWMCLMQTFAQQRTITGKVTDPNGNAVSNASITVKGSVSGTNTDADGNFSISLPRGSKTLTVSSIGFEPMDVQVSGNNVNISLKTRTTTLNDVVVTGYGSQKKKN